MNDSKVLLGIDSYGTVLKCHIEKEIGYKYDPGIDILSVLLEKDINPQFPEDVMQEVQQIPETIQEDDIAQRKDCLLYTSNMRAGRFLRKSGSRMLRFWRKH